MAFDEHTTSVPGGLAVPVAPSPAAFPPPSEMSPFARAQEGLAVLVDAAVRAQRIEAMHRAMHIDVIAMTVAFALRHAGAFVSASLSPARRDEMARRSVVAELAAALRTPERTMQREIDEAWVLSNQLPATLSALRRGELTMQHARVIVGAGCDLADRPRVRAELDERLAALGADLTAAKLRVKARRLREELLAETTSERHRAARETRRVEFEPATDGMAWLHVLLPAADALSIFVRLDDAAHTAAGADVRGVSGRVGGAGRGDEDRNHEQLRADFAGDLLRFGLLPAGDRGAEAIASARATVHVTVPVFTLMGLDETPGHLDGYGPIDADTARRLTATAPSFTRLLTHPVTGAVLDVDRASYRPPADLRRWLRVRDGTCRFPGCNRPAGRSEIDHTRDYADGNPTAHDNLAHLCAGHHHLKHETAWSVVHRGGGILEWRSSSGRVYATHPAEPIPTTPRPADDRDHRDCRDHREPTVPGRVADDASRRPNVEPDGDEYPPNAPF
ncbi:HNH endonuclease signature motif containing protein [Agromyces sp. S2-1-8]|uniref:HNH endonuclease signature motif containing protein n=1 Tax=Agromyces sp. S2-1-8 TaxID=2897180 RepID=UPI001E5242A7|nr:HNH endonuclease signature motif containing protein [Agromyces sp. S2-1-8]MCD5346518.1 HNH endonuclease [Agromyces sp. S2-1-8]